MKQEKTDVITSKELALSIDKVEIGNTRASVMNFVEGIPSNLSTEELAKVMKEFGKVGRKVWVTSSCLIYKALQGLSKKEKTLKLTELGEMLGYGKAAMYRFAQAGDKLINKDYDEVPLSINEFISSESKPCKYSRIVDILLTGSVKLGKVCFYVYSGIRKTIEDKKTDVVFATTTELPISEIEIEITSLVKAGKTLEIVKYYVEYVEQLDENGSIDGEVERKQIDIQYLSISTKNI